MSEHFFVFLFPIRFDSIVQIVDRESVDNARCSCRFEFMYRSTSRWRGLYSRACFRRARRQNHSLALSRQERNVGEKAQTQPTYPTNANKQTNKQKATQRSRFEPCRAPSSTRRAGRRCLSAFGSARRVEIGSVDRRRQSAQRNLSSTHSRSRSEPVAAGI
jgi:hypothetical protein